MPRPSTSPGTCQVPGGPIPMCPALCQLAALEGSGGLGRWRAAQPGPRSVMGGRSSLGPEVARPLSPVPCPRQLTAREGSGGLGRVAGGGPLCVHSCAPGNRVGTAERMRARPEASEGRCVCMGVVLDGGRGPRCGSRCGSRCGRWDGMAGQERLRGDVGLPYTAGRSRRGRGGLASKCAVKVCRQSVPSKCAGARRSGSVTVA